MKISAARADRFARKPDPEVRAVLVYGPDDGLARERAAALVRSVVDDPGDPFRVVELSAAQLREDPARLADEAAALSLTGGRRVIRLRDAGDPLTELLSGHLEEAMGDTLIVLEAGDLPARSSLRKLFEAAKRGAAVPCYRDDERALSALVTTFLGEQGLRAAPDAMAYLTAHLGGDRQVTRRELEKLALYLATAGSGDQMAAGEVGLNDVVACIGDSAELTLEDVALSTADGDLAGLDRALQRCFREGASPIAPLRAVSRHFLRLHYIAGLTADGTPIEAAMKRLRPPVFWKASGRFKAQARRWTGRPLARALAHLLATESACKTTGAPAEALASEALLRIAAHAAARSR